LRRIITEAAEQEKLLKTKDYFVQNGRWTQTTGFG
jgi:hypothetical protein